MPTIEQEPLTQQNYAQNYIPSYNGHTKKLKKITEKNQNAIKGIMIRG